jgi:hypothetical protein
LYIKPCYCNSIDMNKKNLLPFCFFIYIGCYFITWDWFFLKKFILKNSYKINLDCYFIHFIQTIDLFYFIMIFINSFQCIEGKKNIQSPCISLEHWIYYYIIKKISPVDWFLLVIPIFNNGINRIFALYIGLPRKLNWINSLN